jgi:predicted GIY-YIG superfamily endonuclease
MKKYDKFYVYELVNSLGVVEYVGETTNPKQRLKSHFRKIKGHGYGKFAYRKDITMNIVKEFDNRKDAFAYQCELQKKYGFETDLEKIQNHIKKAIKVSSGVNNYLAKLTLKEVNEIRKLYKPRHKLYGCVKLAKLYNVSPTTISDVVNFNVYK